MDVIYHKYSHCVHSNVTKLQAWLYAWLRAWVHVHGRMCTAMATGMATCMATWLCAWLCAWLHAWLHIWAPVNQSLFFLHWAIQNTPSESTVTIQLIFCTYSCRLSSN